MGRMVIHHTLDQDDDSYRRTMIRNFLTGMSTVSGMKISFNTMEVIHDYSKLELLPQFSNLYWLHASFLESFLELMPTFLGCCPNLHTLVLEFEFDKEEWPIKFSYVPSCFVSSLKYVELSTPVTTRTSGQMKLAIYFMRNCAALKKLTLSESFGDDIIKKIKKIPRRSRRNISRLDVRNTKIEDVPASVAESWLRLEKFHIGSKSLKRLTHVPECVSNLDLSNSAIKKIPDCVIGLPGLRSLSIINCRKLVSLQGLPPSLLSLDADDCVLLKSVCLSFSEPKSAYITLDDCKCVKSEKDAIRVTSLFYNPVRGIRLFNCFSLEEEARRVIIQQCDYESVCLPGKEIPPDFTHRAKGNSITIISSGTFSASSRFKACLLLPPDEYTGRTVCRLISKGVVINKLEFYSFHHTLLSEHLLVFSGAVLKEHICCELEATTSEIRFEFDRKYVIECGVQMLADEGEIKLASSFHDPNREVRFINCMKLDEEARRAIVQGWAYKYVCFPGKQIPAEFTHKATGNSITITKGTLSASTSFRACILLSPNLQHPSDYRYQITCCLRSKSVLINDLECYPNSRSWYISGWDHRPLLTEHLFVFHGSLFKKRRWVEVDSDIQFEFSCDQEHYKITECGLQILAEEGERSSRERKEPSGEAVKVSKDENVFKTSKHTSWWRGLRSLV
ncbi:hypothetical protein YC2023_045877 [Brassica napus]